MHKVEAHDFLKQLSPFNRLAEDEVVDLVQFLESAPFVNARSFISTGEHMRASGDC
jgi:signal-transduction protein with cAMP-binding, CBS, and nucleotidyltransferase domain